MITRSLQLLSTINNINPPTSHLPYELKGLNLIASMDDMTVEKEGDTLILRVDEEEDRILDITGIGTIKYLHLFKDGELLFCTNQKAYYSHDWKQYHESTVYDINGNVFVPTAFDNFTMYKHNKDRYIVNGVEMLVWGNYTTAQGTQYENINVWYTKDKGRTIKSSYKFRQDRMDVDNPILFTRHVHNVNYNPADNTFWLSVGDHIVNGVDERHLLKGTYDLDNDLWNWELMGSGHHYKLSNLEFYNGYVYWAWDVTPGGVVKIPYNDQAIKDPTQHEVIMTTDMDCIMVYIGDRGDMLVLQIGYGLPFYTGDKRPRYIYYSPDQILFYKIEGYVPPEVDFDRTWYYSTWAPNSKGKILTGVYALEYSTLANWNLKPSIYLDEILKNEGFHDAFKPLP